jgi:hypothetical protein
VLATPHTHDERIALAGPVQHAVAASAVTRQT